VTYSFTEAEKNTILNGGNVPVSGKSSVSPLEGVFSSIMSVENCTMQISDYYTWCSAGKHNNGEICDAEEKSQHIVTMTMVCQGGLSPQPGTEEPGDDGSGEPGGSTSPNPCSVNGVYTNPQDPASSSCNGGVVTQPNLPFLNNDPCEISELPVSNANALLHESTISTEITSLEGHAANSFTEYGMAIINTGTTTIAQDPYTNNDPNNPGTVTITIPPIGDYLASAHSHPDHGAAPPSVADFYADLKDAKNYPTFQAGFVFANNGTKYAFVVNDRAKAEAFLLANPILSNTTADRTMFNKNSQAGKDFIEILENYTEGRLPSYSGNSQNDGLESAYAEILQKYDTGISIAKTDANGNLNSLHSVPFKYTIPASGGKKITGYRAEKCL